jgi:protein TonB
MFAGLETTQANPRRGWTALTSFTLQAAVIAAAVTLSMLYPSSLPTALMHMRIFVPMTGPPVDNTPANPHPSTGNSGSSTQLPPIVVNQGPSIHFPGPRASAVGPTGPPSINLGGPYGVIPGTIFADVRPPVTHLEVSTQPRISLPMQGYLIHRVEPIYPGIAKSAGIQGEVLIHALISTDGRIEQAQVVRGSPVLAQAAMEAIRQWRYRPYLLNDKPIEVDTEITVNFYLNR